MNKYIKNCIMLMVSIILIYQFYGVVTIRKKVDTLEDSIVNNHNEVINFINNIDSNVSGTLSEELSKAHLTKNVEFKLDEAEKDKYTLGIRAELSRVNNDSEVYFMYKEEGTDKWNEVILNEDGNLSYIGKMEYEIGKEYDYKVVIKGSISESGDIDSVDRYDFIPYPPEVLYGETYEEGKESLNLFVNINTSLYVDEDGNYYESNNHIKDDLKISGIDFIVEIDGKEKVYKGEYYREETNDISGETFDDEGYRVYIPKKDYIKDNKNKIKFIKMKVIYNNGLIDIKDITEDIDISFRNN